MSVINHWVTDKQGGAPREALAAYLHAFSEAGGLILDPFCQSPDLIREALEAQRHVIAVSFDPLDALRTRLALLSISPRDLDAALTRLSDSPKAGLPLRDHLQRLYHTTCARCKKPATAEYFVWERGQDLPAQVHYSCAPCDEAVTKDCDESDSQILHEIQPRGLHYWYILDRVAPQEGNARRLAATLLELYTSRSLYVLSNLLLKVEDLFSGSTIHDALRLGLLQALERGSKLHPIPGEPAPLHSPGLRAPQRHVEWNMWLLFEQAVQRLGQPSTSQPIQLQALPQNVTSTNTPGAKAFVGHLPIRQLVSSLPAASVSLIWVQPPPLGRTLWALPYLWTGCLFGAKQAAALWPLVKRRTADWTWYMQAMRSSLTALCRSLRSDGHLVLIGQSKGHAFHEAVTLAAAGAGLRLEGALYHSLEPETATKPFGGLRGDYRSVWAQGASVPQWPMELEELTAICREAACQTAEAVLQARAEPAPFARLHSHIWEALAQRGILQRALFARELDSPLEWVREQVTTALQRAVGSVFVQVWEDGTEEECLWWLSHPPIATPLSERIETASCALLESAGSVGSANIIQQLYERFAGLLTPDAEWLTACVRSYGNTVASDLWTIKPGNSTVERAQVRLETLSLLRDLGQRWGFDVREGESGTVLHWAQDGRETMMLAVLDSAALGVLLDLPVAGTTIRNFAVIPDVRLDLIRARLARSPLLRRSLAERGWHFIDDQDLSHQASQHDITLADLDALVSINPLASQGRSQLPLL